MSISISMSFDDDVLRGRVSTGGGVVFVECVSGHFECGIGRAEGRDVLRAAVEDGRCQVNDSEIQKMIDKGATIR